jgi:hypothetical protein
MKKAVFLGLGMAAAVAASASIGYAAGVSGPVPKASALNADAIKLLIPENIKWGPAAGLPGTDSYTVTGDPAKPGFYIVLNRFHPGNFSRPHYHANDRHVLVLSGTWWADTGAKWDPENRTVPIKAGTYALHTGREVHYDGARAGGEPAIVAIFGEGPGTRHECEGPTAEKDGPCAEARKASGVPALK